MQDPNSPPPFPPPPPPMGDPPENMPPMGIPPVSMPPMPQMQPMMGTPISIPTNQNAIIALVAMIVSWFILPVIAAIVGVIIGNNAKKEIAASNGTQSGDGMAKVAVIGSWINIGFWVLFGLCMCGLIATGTIAGLNNSR